jgi:hypothetical protein
VKHRAPAPIVVAIIIVLTIASGWALVAPTLLQRLRIDISSLLERRLATLVGDSRLVVTYESASPRFLGSLVIRNIAIRSVTASSAHGETLARIDRAELRYDVSALVRGSFRPLGLRIDGLSLDTTPDGLQNLVESLDSRFGGTQSGRSLPAMSLEIRMASVRIDMDSGAFVEASLKALDAIVHEDGSIGVSAAGTVRGSDPTRRWSIASATVPFSISTTFRLDRPQATISAIISADSDGGRLAPSRLDASLGDAGIDMALEPRDGLARLSAHWNSVSKMLTVDSAFTAWRPQSLFVPSGSLSTLGPWLAAAYSGSITIATDLSAAGTTASVNISGTVPLEVAGGHPRLTLAASGTWDALGVGTATLANSRFSLGFSGDVSPATLAAHGKLEASWLLAPGLRAQTAMDVTGAGASWFAYASTLSAGGVAMHDAAISIELDKDALLFHLDAALPYDDNDGATLLSEVSADAPREAAASTALGRLVIDGTTTLAGEPYLEAAVHIGATRLGSYRGLLDGLIGRSGSEALAPLGLEGDISVFSDFKGLSFNSSSLLLVYDGVVKGFGVTSFSGNAERLEIRSFDATIGERTVSGTASVEYHSPGSSGGSAFSTAIQVQGVPYAVTGTIIGATVSMTGDYGLRFMARRDSGAVIGSLSVTDMPIPVSDGVVLASIESTARFVAADDWKIVLEGASLSQGAGVARTKRVIKASGAFDARGGRFGMLSYSDPYSVVSGAFDVTWTLGDGFRVAINGQASGAEGESYTLNGEYRGDGGINAGVSARRSPLARLAITELRGLVDIDGTITGTVSDPGVDFGFTVNAGQRTNGLPYAMGNGSCHGGMVRLDDTQVRLGNQKLSGLSFDYHTATAAAELSCDVELALGKSLFKGTLAASGVSSSAHGASPLASYTVSGSVSGATWESGSLGDVPFLVSYTRGDTNISIGGNEEIAAHLGSDGTMAASLAASLPMAFKAQGKYADGAISLDVSEARVDLPFLFSVLALPVVSCDSGVATGSLRIRGKLLDPTVEGVIQPENFYLSVPDYVEAPLGPIEEPFYFTGRTLETYQPRIICAGTTVITRMELAMHGGIPDDLHLSVQTAGTGLVPLATTLLGMDIKGRAGTSLEILANPDQTSVRGSIAINSGDIVLTTGLVQQEAATTTEQSPLQVGLDLSFGKAVRVYFPDKRLPILYGQTDPSSHLAVIYDALSGDFSLKGRALLRGGSVFYIQRNFYLKSATMDFDENADQFDPKVSLEAETRSRSDTGPVLITLRATDRRLSDLSFTLESVPTMSETTIIQLLGQNLLGVSSDGQMDLGRALVENSDLIPQLNVMSVLERNLQDVLGLDLFMIRSQVFQRWLYDFSGLSGTSSLTTLADYLDNTEIVGGKYIGDRLFFQTMLSLSSDPLATGTTLSLDSEFSLEWKAPHFTLYWSIQPKHPETLFIEDQSFSFLWRIPLK